MRIGPGKARLIAAALLAVLLTGCSTQAAQLPGISMPQYEQQCEEGLSEINRQCDADRQFRPDNNLGTMAQEVAWLAARYPEQYRTGGYFRDISLDDRLNWIDESEYAVYIYDGTLSAEQMAEMVQEEFHKMETVNRFEISGIGVGYTQQTVAVWTVVAELDDAL